MEQPIQAQGGKTPKNRITRKFEGKTSAETLVRNLIRAHIG